MLLGSMTIAIAGFAQTAPSSPVDEVRRTVGNETNPASNSPKHMFLDRKQTPQGSQTKLLVETRDAMAGIIIANNDKPLNAAQRQAEIARVDRFIKDPGELKKKAAQEKETAERTERIVKALPDAFIYEPAGTEIGRPGVGKSGDKLLRLKFQPNPKYQPPSHVEQVLTGMAGYLLLDATQHRLAKIDGTLIKDVGFGWGILGHLNKGGNFVVEQGDVGDGDWEITRMALNLTGKILLFKSLNIQSNEVFSNFKQVPANLTFAQGVALLRKQETAMGASGNIAPNNTSR
ncbi:MAG: hypothetical protein JOY93_01985 [Acidobacteriales bacterium]|nr:hypothetical protein [Terriglobales bacterium]